MQSPIKIVSKANPELRLTVIPGHFSSDRFHVNYYIDMTTLKMRYSQCKLIAAEMAKKYVHRLELRSNSNWLNTLMTLPSAQESIIDTIICLDGCETIGAYMADELASRGVSTHNTHASFYIISPEFDSAGQMVVRDNIRPMIKGKNVLILLASAMSGRTITKSINCIKAYGGNVQGISVIFGNVTEIEGYPVNAVFTTDDLPDFKLSSPEECSDCKNGKPLDAIVNSYGYTQL